MKISTDFADIADATLVINIFDFLKITTFCALLFSRAH